MRTWKFTYDRLVAPFSYAYALCNGCDGNKKDREYRGHLCERDIDIRFLGSNC